jgi:hypothetical protein
MRRFADVNQTLRHVRFAPKEPFWPLAGHFRSPDRETLLELIGVSQTFTTAEVKRHAITCATLDDIVQSLLDEFSDYRHGAFRFIADCRKQGNRSN